MNLSLDMSMKLQQKLSYQLIQSLKLLQVNTLQLEQLLKTEIEMNPVLETAEELEETQENELEQEEQSDADEADAGDDDDELEVNEDDIDWEEYLEDGFDLGGRVSEEADRGGESDNRHETVQTYKATLAEHLTRQADEKKISERLRLLVVFLINSLDNDGYLRTPLQDLAGAVDSNCYELEEALSIIQKMDPSGVGARNLRECLCIQLSARHLHDSLATRIVQETWSLFERMKIPDISRYFGVEPGEVQRALDIIKTLNPKPGYAVATDEPSIIVPDLIVEKIDGEFVVMLNDRSTPSLRINKSYANMVRRGSTAGKDVKKYVRDKLNNAVWLIRAIEQRKATMLKVMYAIIERQREFFENGSTNLNPLKLQDIADMISMHISTVSRVTNGKYVQTPHGVFELKFFFSESMGQDSGGANVSVEQIKNRIRELVEQENSQKPLSDQQISDIFKKSNFSVARRTVAKYREQLKILPARLRQKYE